MIGKCYLRKLSRIAHLRSILAVALVLAILMTASLVSSSAGKRKTGGGISPGWYTDTADQNIRIDTPYFTIYTFKMFPPFWEMFFNYDGDIMLLIRNCSGPNGTVSIQETNTGNPVMTFTYHGQKLIAINGWEYTTSFRGVLTSDTWGGSAVLAKDWRAGTWAPDKGVLVEHPKNIILGNAELSLGYSVPGPRT